MGSQYGGLSANISGALPAALNISSTTNTNPIVVTTSGAHNLQNGAMVSINEHQTNTTANGTWVATVLSSNTFSIPSGGVAAGGATGTVQSLAPGAAAIILGDGDSGSAANFNNPLIADLDRTTFLAARLGAYKPVGVFFVGASVPFSSWGSIVGGLAANTWSDWGSGGLMPFVAGGAGTFPVQANDIVVVNVVTSFNYTVNSGDSPTTQYTNGLWHSFTVPGGTPSYAFSNTSVDSIVQVPASGALTLIEPITLSHIYTAGVAGNFDFKLRVMANANTSRTLALQGTVTATVQSFRVTGMPQ